MNNVRAENKLFLRVDATLAEENHAASFNLEFESLDKAKQFKEWLMPKLTNPEKVYFHLYMETTTNTIIGNL